MKTELQEVIAIIDALFTIAERTVVVQCDDLRLLGAAAKECDSAKRELERWRHGVTVEGDFVCPDSLECERLRTANAELLEACRDAIDSAPVGCDQITASGIRAVLAKWGGAK